LASQGRFEEIPDLVAGHCKSHPGEAQVLVSAASILVSAGAVDHVNKLRPLFDQFIAANPDRVEGYLALAMVVFETGELAEAEKAYRRLLELDPYHQQALNNLAWILGEELGRPEEALVFARKGVTKYPNDPHLLNTRGVVFFRLDMLTEARKDLERCLTMVRDIPSTRAKTLLYLGRIYMRQGETALAKRTLRQVLEIDRQHKVLTDDERAETEQLVNASS